MRTNWFEHFFHGLALEFWRNAVSHEDTRLDVDFIQSELALPVGSHILDIPCGNGRHSLELAKRGYLMTCVDISSEFVAEARNVADKSGVKLTCLSMDMRQIDFEETFDGAFCFGNSFGYMDRDSNLDFVVRIARSLKPGGQFMMETGVTAESLLPALPARRWHRVNDIIVISENRYDAGESELHTDYTFIRGGVMESGTATYRVYTVAELKALLASCGLVVTSMYGSRDRTPFHLGDRLFLTGRKMSK